MVGKGTSDTDRSNALEVMSNGNVNIAGNLKIRDVTISETDLFIMLDLHDLHDLHHVIKPSDGVYSIAMGDGTTANGEASTAMGKYTVDKPEALLMVGNGEDSSRSNAFEVMSNGNANIAGNTTI